MSIRTVSTTLKLTALTAVFAIASMFMNYSPTHALDCVGPGNDAKLAPLEHMQQSTYVFRGRAISTELVERDNQTMFHDEYRQIFMIENWVKGGRNGEVLFRTDATWSAPLEENVSYIMVYSRAVEDGDGDPIDESRPEFNTPLCPSANENIIHPDNISYNEYSANFVNVEDTSTEPLALNNFPALSIINLLLPLLISLFGGVFF